MSDYDKFVKLINSIANINHVISSLESIGLNVDENAFEGALFRSFDGLVVIAMDLLNLTDSPAHNDVYNKMIGVEKGNCESLIKELWNEYRIK